MSSPESELLPTKPAAHPRLYAWSSDEVARRWRGCLKVGQTTRDVNTRIKESQGQTRVDYTVEVDESAERPDGPLITDVEVRRRLIDKGFDNVVFESSKEWMRCSADDVKTAIAELRAGVTYEGTHHATFGMRDEQASAVEKTLEYFASRWAEDADAVPEFLWNAKMRFGKTFTTYQLAKKMGARLSLIHI